MKFISKSSNLYIVLRPGMQAQPLTGTPAVPTLGARFQNGIIDVQDEAQVEMMRKHPGYNVDFIEADPITNHDPFKYLRQEVEPAHVLQEMKYGQPTGRNVSPTQATLPPEILKMIQDQAMEMAKEMLPGMLKAIVAEANKDKVSAESTDTSESVQAEVTTDVQTEPAATTPRRGRPAKPATV